MSHCAVKWSSFLTKRISYLRLLQSSAHKLPSLSLPLYLSPSSSYHDTQTHISLPILHIQCDQMAEIKSSLNFPKFTQKVVRAVFTFKLMFSKYPITSSIFLGYFSKKICHQEISKIAQSGHTVYIVARLRKSMRGEA